MILLAVVSRELVAAEAWYHRSCYREYTRPTNETSTVNTTGAASEEETEDLKNEAFEELFAYIRSDLLKNPRLISMGELKEMLLSFMRAKGISSEAPAKNLKRKLKAEFGEVLQFEDLLDNVTTNLFHRLCRKCISQKSVLSNWKRRVVLAMRSQRSRPKYP